MSNSRSSSPAKSPSTAVFVWATLGAVGTILLVGILVWLFYFYSSKGPVTEDIVAQRKATLAEVQAKQQQLISEYVWIDKENDVVRIPIEQAMKLTIKDLHNKQKK